MGSYLCYYRQESYVERCYKMYGILSGSSLLLRILFTLWLFKNISFSSNYFLNGQLEDIIIIGILHSVTFAIVGRINLGSYGRCVAYFFIYLLNALFLWSVLSLFTFFHILPIN